MKTRSTLLVAAALLISSRTIQAGENRTVSAFTKIENSVPLDIILEKGSTENVSVEVSGVDPHKIITKVIGGTLKVHMENGNHSDLKGKIIITYVTLSEITNTGSGDLTCKSDLTATDFILNNSGSGDIELQGKVIARAFHFHHKGSGDVTLVHLQATDLVLSMLGSGNFKVLSGNATKQSIDLSGSGDVEIADLSGESCTVVIKGSGNVETNVSNSLQGSILGSGNITYKGEPKEKRVEVKGSGSVSKG